MIWIVCILLALSIASNVYFVRDRGKLFQDFAKELNGAGRRIIWLISDCEELMRHNNRLIDMLLEVRQQGLNRNLELSRAHRNIEMLIDEISLLEDRVEYDDDYTRKIPRLSEVK